MTEDEAKTKWCPFAHLEGAGNRHSDNSPAVLCIGSDCMAWRWVGSHWRQSRKDGSDEKLHTHFGSTLVVTPTNPIAEPIEIKRGCCGLAEGRTNV